MLIDNNDSLDKLLIHGNVVYLSTINIDNMGRFVVPAMVRKKFDIKNNNEFMIFVKDNVINFLNLSIDKSLSINKFALRKIDSLGRLMIPSEFRKELKINEGSKIRLGVLSDGFMKICNPNIF